MSLSNTSRMLRHSIFLLVTLFFMIKVVSSQYGNGATKYRYRNKPIKEREEAVNSLNILRDIFQRFEHPSLPYQQNQDIVMEKSRIRLRNPAAAHTAKRQPPVPYYLRNRPVSYDRYETRNNNRHRTSMRNRQQLFYEDFDPSIDRRPAARPPQVITEKRPQRPSVSAATMTSRQPIKQLLDLNKDDDNEIHIDGHVHHPDEATYKPVSAYEEPIYQNNHQTESYEEEPNNASYEPNQQQQYQQDGGYAVNLDNHQMVEVKPPADDSYAVTPPEYNRPAYYDEDDKVEKKKYNLKVNLYLHNYRNGRINTANTELIQKETVA